MAGMAAVVVLRHGWVLQKTFLSTHLRKHMRTKKEATFTQSSRKLEESSW